MAINWGRSIGWNLDFIALKREGMEYTIIENGADCYPWVEYFAILPRKTVTGKRIFWTKAYKRKVWVVWGTGFHMYKRKVWVVWGTGFHMEPKVQYATAFDLLTYDDNNYSRP